VGLRASVGSRFAVVDIPRLSPQVALYARRRARARTPKSYY